jgi:hypothetical protein
MRTRDVVVSASAVIKSAPTKPVLSDIASLLRAYDRVLSVSEEVPASIRVPVWPMGRGVNVALHRALRPDLGAQHWTARHMRRTLSVLERGFARRAAVVRLDQGIDGRALGGADRDRLRDFRDSLPSPVPRFAFVAFVIAALVLTQALFNGLPDLIEEQASGQLKEAVARLGPSPDVTSIRDLIDGLVHANRIELLIFVTAVCWSSYCLLRLPAGGYRLAMLALGQEGQLKLLRRGSELDAATQDLHTQACELRAFEALGVRPPAIFPVDLATKALLWTPVLLLAAGGLKYILQTPVSEQVPADIPGFGVLIAVTLARLTYFHWICRKRHAAMGWLWKGAALVFLTGLIVPLES